MPPSEGICNGYTRRTMNATFAIPYRFLQPISRSSTIFPLRFPIFHSRSERSLFGKDREREKEREGGGEESLFAQATGVRERKTRCVFFPPLAEETRRNVVPTLSPRNLREPGFVNRTVFRDGRRGEEDEERRGDRSGAKIPADWWWREAGITNREKERERRGSGMDPRAEILADVVSRQPSCRRKKAWPRV